MNFETWKKILLFVTNLLLNGIKIILFLWKGYGKPLLVIKDDAIFRVFLNQRLISL